MAVASQLSRSEAKPCHPRYLVGLATRTSAWAVRTGLCPITCYKPLFLWLPLGLVAMLRYLDLDHSRRTPWLFFQGRWRDVEIRLGLRPRNLAGYLDWIFWHTPRRGKKREAKMDQASFFFLWWSSVTAPGSWRPSSPWPQPRRPHASTTPVAMWTDPDVALYHGHPNLEAGRSSSLPRKGRLVPRWWVARGKNHNKTDASDPRPPATARWALGHALVGFRFLPFQPPRGRNNMTRDGGPRVCMEVPRGRGIGHRNLNESLFKQRPAPSSQWNPIQVVGQTPPCLPPSPWC